MIQVLIDENLSEYLADGLDKLQAPIGQRNRGDFNCKGIFKRSQGRGLDTNLGQAKRHFHYAGY